MDAAALLAEHARSSASPGGSATSRCRWPPRWACAGTRGSTARSSRWRRRCGAAASVPAGRALDLSGAPAALPAWTAAAASTAPTGRVALGRRARAAAWAAATLDAGARQRRARALVAALPWEVEGPFDTIVWRPPADRGVRSGSAPSWRRSPRRSRPTARPSCCSTRTRGRSAAERAAAERFERGRDGGREAGWRVSLLRPGPAGPGRRPRSTWTSFEAPAVRRARSWAPSPPRRLDPGTAVLLRALAAGGGAPRRPARGSSTSAAAPACWRAPRWRRARRRPWPSTTTWRRCARPRRRSARRRPRAGSSTPTCSPTRRDARSPTRALLAPPGASTSCGATRRSTWAGRWWGRCRARSWRRPSRRCGPAAWAWFVVNRALPYEREFAAWARTPTSRRPANGPSPSGARACGRRSPSAAARPRAGAAPSTS
jgi:hypothetical protein